MMKDDQAPQKDERGNVGASVETEMDEEERGGSGADGTKTHEGSGEGSHVPSSDGSHSDEDYDLEAATDQEISVAMRMSEEEEGNAEREVSGTQAADDMEAEMEVQENAGEDDEKQGGTPIRGSSTDDNYSGEEGNEGDYLEVDTEVDSPEAAADAASRGQDTHAAAPSDDRRGDDETSSPRQQLPLHLGRRRRRRRLTRPGAVSVTGPAARGGPAIPMAGLRRHENVDDALFLPPAPYEVTATLVVEDDDDRRCGRGDEEAGQTDDLSRGVSRRSSAATSITVQPVDYAHAVAIPDEAAGGTGGGHRKLSDALFRDRRVCAVVTCLLIAVCAAAGAVAAVFALSSRQSSDGARPQSPGAESGKEPTDSPTFGSNENEPTVQQKQEDSARLNEVRDVLLPLYSSSVSSFLSPDVLSDPSSAQHAALRWLAFDDEAELHHSYINEIQQRYLVVLLYFATGGDTSWMNGFDFLGRGHECRWPEEEEAGYWGARGIFCDEELKITTISLYSNNLTGTVPPELLHLTHLDKLHLLDNNIGGTIPPSLGKLSVTTELLISMNSLTGTIPPELGQMSSVKILSLWGNELTGIIPPELGALDTLELLVLNNNTLSGTVPEELGQLTNMVHLALYANELSGSLDFFCESGRNWSALKTDCLEEVECSCCTECF